MKLLLAALPALLAAAPAIDYTFPVDTSNLLWPQTAADAQGNLLIAGYAKNCNLPAIKALSICGPVWLAKFDAATRAIVFATYLGSPAPSGTVAAGNRLGLAAAADGTILIAVTASVNAFTPLNSLQPAIRGQGNIYAARLAADGSRLIYGSYIGGEGYDHLESLTADASAAAYLLITTNSSAFPLTPPSPSTSAFGKSAVVKIPPSGGALAYSVTFPWEFFLRPIQLDPLSGVMLAWNKGVSRIDSAGATLRVDSNPAWPSNAYPWALPAADGGTWYAGTAANGLYPLTRDAAQPYSGPSPYQRIEIGQSMPAARPIRAHAVRDFAVDPFERFRVYAATDAGLFRTEDNGWTWDQLTTGETYSIAVDPFDQNILYLGAPGLLRSADRGGSWDATFGISDPVISIAPDPNIQNLITVATPNAVYRNNGPRDAWLSYQLAPPLPGNSPSSTLSTKALQAVADPTRPGRVYVLGYASCLGFCPVTYSLFQSDLTSGFRPLLIPGSFATPPLQILADPASGDLYALEARKFTVFRANGTISPDSYPTPPALAMALDPDRPGAITLSLADGSVVSGTSPFDAWTPIAKMPAPARRLITGDGGVIHAGQQTQASDAIVYKIDSTGQVRYGTYFGAGDTEVTAAVTTPDGRLFLGGVTGEGLPVLNAAQPGFAAGSRNGFVAEFDPAGKLLRSTYLAKPTAITAIYPMADGSIIAAGTIGAPSIPGLPGTIVFTRFR